MIPVDTPADRYRVWVKRTGNNPGLRVADCCTAARERLTSTWRHATATSPRRDDTMDPGQMDMLAGRLPQRRYLYCPDGSHLAMYDDQAVYLAGLIDFLHGLERT